MRIEEIRHQLLKNRVIFKHARVEAEKDGLDELDMREALITGRVVEDYQPERKRVLVAGSNADEIPIHLVVDFSRPDHLRIVTVYIPDRAKFAGYHHRVEK
jgi:hypothetical protein